MNHLIPKIARYFLILIFGGVFYLSGFAINSDSLWQVWNNKSLPDTARMDALKRITWKVLFINPDSGIVLSHKLYRQAVQSNNEYMKSWSLKVRGIAMDIKGDYDEAMNLYNQGLAIAEKAGLLQEQANFYTNIALIYRNQGDYEKALDANRKSLDLRKKVNDVMGTAATYNNIAVIYIKQGNIPAGLEYFQKNLKLNLQRHDTARIARSVQNIGLVYLDQGDLKRALNYLNQSLSYYKTLDYKRMISYTYSNIGVIYKEMQKYNQALDYYQKALDLAETIDEKSIIASIYRNMGNIFNLKEDNNTALDYFKKSLKLQKELGNKRGIISSYNDIGSISNQMGNPQLAIKWCRMAYREAKESDYLEETRNSSKCLMRAYKALGNINKAFRFQEEYYAARDSLDNREDYKKVTRLSVKYEYEKAHLADSLAMVQDNLKTKLLYQANLNKAQNRLYIILSFGIIVLIIAAALFWRLNFIRKTNRELEGKNKIIEFEKFRAEESERSKEQFFSNVSHELRTPLTLIIGPLQKIFNQITDKQIRNELEIMERNARRLKSMINELLDLYKLESGKIKIKVRKEDIVEFLKQFVETFNSLAEEKKIKLAFHSSVKEMWIYFDREKLENIIGNLLSNAFKFTNSGGKIFVDLIAPSSNKPKEGQLAEGEEGEVKISIRDTGIGIPAEKQPHIFNRFYQVDDVLKRNVEGTGIGLALTKELVDLHHGSIGVESEEGKGSVFTVSLRKGKAHFTRDEIADYTDQDSATQAEETEGVNADHTEQLIDGLFDKSKDVPIILVVEDNKDMRSYIRSCIEPPYRVIEAKDGVKGLDKAISHIPDLIVSDVMMPRMNGNEMARKLKADERTSHIPIILLTARRSVEYKIKGLETGADDYLEKPFNARELTVRIKNLIEQRKKLREQLLKNMGVDFVNTGDGQLASIDEQFLQKALEIVSNYISDSEFTVESFAREMAMSRVQLHRKIKALTGQSAGPFIRSIRLKKAAENLRNKDANITQTAYEMGFNNISYFAKCFNKEFGMTPSEYIATNRKQK